MWYGMVVVRGCMVRNGGMVRIGVVRVGGNEGSLCGMDWLC